MFDDENICSITLTDGTVLPFMVLESGAGFYIGTWYEGPYSRESAQYWYSREEAQQALDSGRWIPRK